MRKIIILLMFLIVGAGTIYGQVRKEHKNKRENSAQSLRDKYETCFSEVYCPICGKCIYSGGIPNTHGNKSDKYWTYDYVCKEHGKVVSIPFWETDKRYKKRTNANKINSKYSVHEVKSSCFRKDSIKTNDGVIYYTITNLCKNTLYFYIESLNICCILNHQKTSSPIKTNSPIILKLTHNEKVWQNWVPSGTPIID